jgi:hypothetical protein
LCDPPTALYSTEQESQAGSGEEKRGSSNEGRKGQDMMTKAMVEDSQFFKTYKYFPALTSISSVHSVMFKEPAASEESLSHLGCRTGCQAGQLSFLLAGCNGWLVRAAAAKDALNWELEAAQRAGGESTNHPQSA